jgi:micrococcal nuclease
VVRVADGDTLTVQFDDGEEETIRFLDVDTPETVHPTRPEECYGAQASDFTKTLMGQRVGIEEMGRDRYGRLLAYVWTEPEEGGQLWNVRLLEEGLAVYNDYGNPGKYADTSRAAAENALLSGVGLWSACTLGEPATPTPAPTPTPVPTRSAQDGQAVCPQGCVSQPDPSCSIKGNVNTRNDTKIYHVEGVSSSYNRVNMKESDGDLWFCTIEEAEANGFRAPRN